MGLGRHCRFATLLAFLLIPLIADCQTIPIPFGTKAVSGGNPLIKNRTIKFDSSKLGGVTQTDFTVLISIVDATLKTVSNGGNVANSLGYDIRFFLVDTNTLLNWDLEYYDGTTGTVVAWVKVSTVNAFPSTATSIIMNYGSPSVSTFQGGATGTAWSNALAVYFLNEATGSNLVDHSGNGNTGTQHGSPVQSTGKIGYAELMTSTSTQYYDCGAFASMDGIAHLSMVSWMKRNTANKSLLFTKSAGGGRYHGIEPYSDGQVYFLINTAFASTSDNTTTWHMYSMLYDGTQSTNNTKILTIFDATNMALGWSGTVPSVTPSTMGNFYIGRDNGLNENQNGLTDFCIIYSVTRTTSWITTMYNNQNNPGNIGSPAFCTYSSEF